MKNNIKSIVIAFFLVLTSCVQETKTHKITMYLDVSNEKNIEKVGVRGQGNPLSWDSDLEMEEINKDRLYKVTFESKTGRLCNEFKFTINGNFEFQDQENRKVYFNQAGETIYKAVFNRR